MPNWACNEMHVYGNKKQLVSFYNMVKKATSKDNPLVVKNSWDEKWLGNIFIEGMDLKNMAEENIDKEFEKLDIFPRGWIEDIQLEIEDGQGPVPSVYIMYQSAWDSRAADFDKLLAYKFPELKQVTRCIESDNCVFYHTDVDNLFFTDGYYSDIQYKTSNGFVESVWGEFSSEKELIDEINSTYGLNIKNLNEIKDLIDENLEHDPDYNYYVEPIVYSEA